VGLECPVRISKSCFCDPHEVCPFLGPFPLQKALPEAILDLRQGKREHNRRAPENAQDVVFPSYAAHRDAFDEFASRRGVRRDEGVGHAREFCMAFVRECGIDLITVTDGDPGRFSERLPDLRYHLQFFQAFQDSFIAEAEGPLHPERGVFHEDEPEPFALQPHPQAVVRLGDQAFFSENLAGYEVIVCIYEEAPEDVWVKRCRLDELLVSAEASGYGLIGRLCHDLGCRGRLDMLSNDMLYKF